MTIMSKSLQQKGTVWHQRVRGNLDCSGRITSTGLLYRKVAKPLVDPCSKDKPTQDTQISQQVHL